MEPAPAAARSSTVSRLGMEWEEAMAVLDGWDTRLVVVVPFLDPGISLHPVAAPLAVERPRAGVVRLALPGMPISLRRAIFIRAGWVPGRDRRGLSIVQGGARVDVFLDGDAGGDDPEQTQARPAPRVLGRQQTDPVPTPRFARPDDVRPRPPQNPRSRRSGAGRCRR